MVSLHHKYTIYCNSITPMTPEGKIDVPAFRAHLRRVADAGASPNVGGGGTGESGFMTLKELELLYRTAVEECKTKVPVYALTPESRTAAEALKVANIAHKAGVDRVQLYSPDVGHGGKPTPPELEQFFRELLDGINYPVCVATGFPPGQSLGISIPSSLVESLCKSYPQITAINVQPGYPVSRFVEYRDRARSARPGIELITSNRDQLMAEYLHGSSGWYGFEANIAPKLCQSMANNLSAGRMDKAGEDLEKIFQMARIVGRWAPGSVRGGKAALQAMGFPGGNGNVHRPYLPISENDAKQLRAELEAMGLRKIEGLAATR